MKKQYLSINETAELLRITRRSVYNLIQRRKLRKIRVSGINRSLIPMEDIEKILNRKG